MKLLTSLLPLALSLGSTVQASPEPATDAVLEERTFPVTVNVPAGSIRGRVGLGVETFAGIPYAEWPVGDLRLRPPKRREGKLQNWDATGISPACPQQFVSTEAGDVLDKLLGPALKLPFVDQLEGKEECLTVTVTRPAGTKPGDKLPVLFWIFGGGFGVGSTNTYDATSLVTDAASKGQPIIYVGVNYRLNGFGFLPGKEVLADGATNLGMRDQRMGLEWVADNIDAFGGDSSKVTIWGESAGSISVFNQMLYKGGDAMYKGKPLFRGAIMNSGSVAPAGPVDCPKGQAVYDEVVRSAGCSGAQDTLDCLRKLPYKQFFNAVSALPGILSYNSVALSYLPRADGDVLPESPDIMVTAGKGYWVPSIIGDQEDEGTLFSLFNGNITDTPKLVDYLSSLYFPKATKAQLTEYVNTYPETSTAGSPFRTGLFNEYTPGFKRRAAILGDLVFTLSRRVMLNVWKEKMPEIPIWSYLSSYDYGTPIMGTFHASDIIQIFYGILPNNAAASCRTYYFNFVYNLDPNKGNTRYAKWPLWKDNRMLMWFKGPWANSMLKDDFRKESSDFLEKNIEVFRL